MVNGALSLQETEVPAVSADTASHSRRILSQTTPPRSDPLAHTPSYEEGSVSIDQQTRSSRNPDALTAEHHTTMAYQRIHSGTREPQTSTLPRRPTTAPSSTGSQYDTAKCVVPGAVANLCSATLGAGVLALPYALLQAGLVVGLGLLLLSAAATIQSIQILARACDEYQLYTYERLVHQRFGKHVRTAVEIAVVVFCGGCAVAYVVAVGDILEQSDLLLYNSRALSCLALWCVAMLPLSLLRRVQSLQWASGVGVASIGTLVLAALVHWIDHDKESHGSNGTNQMAIFQAETESLSSASMASLRDFMWPVDGLFSVLTAFPIVLFAFACQTNVCQIYHELPCFDQNKTELMTRVARHAVALCTFLYTSISVIALADLGASVQPNVLSSYEDVNKGISILQIACGAMAAAVIMAFPLCIFPARVTLNDILYPEDDGDNSNDDVSGGLTAALLENDDTDNIRMEQSSPQENVSTVPSYQKDVFAIQSHLEVGEYPTSDWQFDIGRRRHVVSTVLLAGSALGLALVVPNISVVFGLLGGTTTSLLGFCVPGMLGLELCKQQERQQQTSDNAYLYQVSWMLLVGGVLIGVVTTAVTVYSMVVS